MLSLTGFQNHETRVEILTVKFRLACQVGKCCIMLLYGKCTISAAPRWWPSHEPGKESFFFGDVFWDFEDEDHEDCLGNIEVLLEQNGRTNV